MKIAMLGLRGIPATYGGIERHVEELAARLAECGHRVTVYCRSHYTRLQDVHRGVRLRRLPSVNTKHLDNISHTALALADAMRSRFDVLHFHGIGPAFLSFAPCLLQRGKCAVVATVHSLDWRRRKWGPFARLCLRLGERAAVRFPHRTIVVSRELRKYFRGQGREVVHIPNGVTKAFRQPIRELARFGLSEGGFILWIGRFVPEKRVADLIGAFRNLSTERRLVLAGELDESDPHVRALKTAAAGDPRIVFTGGLYGPDKAEALTNACLAVFPSDLEGFPIALLEAMRYGLPVLASDIPEHLETVTPGVNGFVFPTADVDALRAEMAGLLAYPEEAASAARNAEQSADAYDWDNITAQTESVYRQAGALTAAGLPPLTK